MDQSANYEMIIPYEVNEYGLCACLYVFFVDFEDMIWVYIVPIPDLCSYKMITAIIKCFLIT